LSLWTGTILENAVEVHFLGLSMAQTALALYEATADKKWLKDSEVILCIRTSGSSPISVGEMG